MHVDDGMWDGDAVLKAVGAVVCGGGGFRRFQVHDAKEGFIKRPWSSWRMASAADKGALTCHRVLAAAALQPVRPGADEAGFLDMRMRVADFTNKLA
jgi:hypothetical protein